MEQYVHSLLCEANLRQEEVAHSPITTLYMGGGTPSVLPVELITELVNGLHA